MKRDPRGQLLRRQLQQLILLRETGPKSAAWHQARTRMIWRATPFRGAFQYMAGSWRTIWKGWSHCTA